LEIKVSENKWPTGEDELPITYYRVDALDFCMNWKEYLRANNERDANTSKRIYERMYPGCPVRVRKVTEEKV
jgi:hypothetical protein